MTECRALVDRLLISENFRSYQNLVKYIMGALKLTCAKISTKTFVSSVIYGFPHYFFQLQTPYHNLENEAWKD